MELQPACSYRMRELTDNDSPWWDVAYTELAKKTAALILFYV